MFSVPFSKPLGYFSVASRSTAEVAADGRRLATIEGLVPEQEVRSAVRTYLEHDYGAQAERGARLRLRKGLLARFLLKAARGPSDRIIEAEVQTATREFARHWTNILLVAWKRFGEHRGYVQLGEDLLPSQEVYGKEAEWLDWRDISSKSRASLLSTIAMTRENVERISLSFSMRANQQIRKAPLQLPDGIDIALDDPWAKPVLRPRGRDTGELAPLERTSDAPATAGLGV